MASEHTITHFPPLPQYSYNSPNLPGLLPKSSQGSLGSTVLLSLLFPVKYGLKANRCSAKPCQHQNMTQEHRISQTLSVKLLLLRFPARCLGFTISGEIFAYVAVFSCNPTIEVVTLRLCGWCMLDVFFLPAVTCPGHERQDLLSPCDGMHMCTD